MLLNFNPNAGKFSQSIAARHDLRAYGADDDNDDDDDDGADHEEVTT